MNVNKLLAEQVADAAALEERLFSHPWKEKDFSESLSDPARAFFGCTEGERLLGYCGLQWSGEQGDILTIGVEPACRRKGAGAALMEEAIKECRKRGVKELFLEVRESNLAARGLYEKCGFTLLYARKNYYSDPKEDGLIYRLEVME